MGSVTLLLVLLGIAAVHSIPASDGARSRRDSPSLPEPGVCGLSLADRIVGGTRTAINAYPWASLLMAQHKDGGQTIPFCGASLISDRFVLSAAHCFPEPSDSFIIAKVRLGEWDILSKKDCEEDYCSDNPIDATVESFEIHKDYSGEPDFHNDIALVKLANPVTFTEFISPVCLPAAEKFRTKSISGRKFTAVGWGDIKYDAKNRDVQIGNRYKFEVKLPGVGLETCRTSYPNLKDTEMCAGKTGKDTCQGDSGGPLSIAENDGYWYQYGVVSYGYGCGWRGYPGVYTRVTSFIPWIKDTMKKLSKTTAKPTTTESSSISSDWEYLIHILNNIYNDPCSDIKLIIQSLVIEDGKLYPRWLELNESIRIHQLELKQSEIIEIPSGSFDARHFYAIAILTLDSLKVSVLPSNIFLGLQLLQELNLKNLPLEHVDEFVLAPVKFTLTSLLVESCLNGINPRVFTGSTSLDNLAIVSFEFNILDDVLTDDSFSMIPSLSSLYLRNSGIRILREGMFAGISKSIQQIHLNGNELHTIEAGVFDSLLEKQVKIYLGNNPFMCDCSLAYLKQLIITYPSMFDDVKCVEPPPFSGWSVSDAEFCNAITDPPTTTTEIITTSEVTDSPEETTEMTTETTESTKPQPSTRPTGEPTKPTGPPTTSTTTVTSTTTTSTTTEPSSTSTSPLEVTTSSVSTTPSTTTTPATSSPANIFTMQCIQTAVPIESEVTSYQGSELTLHKRSKTFTVLESQEGAVELILDQTYSSALILWFYDTSTTNSIFSLQIEDSAGCADIYGRTVRITNLIPDKNYIFCVIYRAENTISPFDCLPHRLLPTYGQRTWLVEDQKIMIISILIASVLVAIMSGIVLTYCFIKSFDTYQKSCRKVTTEVRIDRSTTNQCYMTPVAEQPARTRHKRSVSDSSIESCRSYVSAVVPATQFQYISWKMDNRSRHPSAPPHPTQQQPSMEFYPKDPPPPPLPPHPSKRLKKQKSEIKINFHEIYDEPNSSSFSSSVHKNFHQGKH